MAPGRQNRCMEKKTTNFIKNIIDEDLKNNKNDGKVITRFPPEPNGCLHIGHAKAFCLNFGLAQDYKGVCHLRFDDTNPEKEDESFAKAIKEDIKWMGFDWKDKLHHASDYFEKLYFFAEDLIKQGKAFVCDLNAEEMRKYRGSLTEPGKESPYRNRTVEENLKLFQDMRAGKFKDGEKVLRAKIDMSSGNVNMRDPIIYRVKRATHQRTADDWCIYPMYDFCHCLSDSIEEITHSCCSLEFEDHRPLYNWFLDELKTPAHPQQIEFARLNLNYTVMSKRLLTQLVETKVVNGWDDPRLPTISGMRRRGYPASAIRNFLEAIGWSKKDTIIDYSILEDCVRNELNETCPRAFGVINPIKVVIDNYPEDKTEVLQAPIHPMKPELGTREITFSKTVYIDRNDFHEDPPKKFFRLGPDKNVRLRYAYVIKCNEIIKDNSGEIVELHCIYFPDTLGGKTPEGMKKVKGIVHWLSDESSFKAEVRIYDRLFSVENPMGDKDKNFLDFFNKGSLQKKQNALIENVVKNTQAHTAFQFEREGYFSVDPDSTSDKMILNRVVTLRDSWAKLQKKQK